LKLATVRRDQSEVAAIIIGGGVVPVDLINELHGTRWEEDIFGLLRTGQLYELQIWLANLANDSLSNLPEGAANPDQVSYGPLYRRPRKIWGIGLNYVEHAADLKENLPSEEPASFMKPDTAIIGPDDPVRLPVQSRRVTAEAELGIIIGREARDVAEEDAPSVVAGLTTVIDLTAEDILEKNPRYLTRAKSFDTFFSFGPQLLTLDELEEVDQLEVATVINGKFHRKNSVSNMTFSPWFLVSFHSRVMTLLPGDIISTGTPGAVVIRDGDTVACEIGGFETLSNPVEDPGAQGGSGA
jgi:2-keto-4-pentenoate hydratase/2-oxohepta-3-ene-1,7-dioic acid hydratase in catechol pathway